MKWRLRKTTVTQLEKRYDQSHVYLWPRNSLGMESNFLGLIPYANEITRLFVVT